MPGVATQKEGARGAAVWPERRAADARHCKASSRESLLPCAASTLEASLAGQPPDAVASAGGIFAHSAAGHASATLELFPEFLAGWLPRGPVVWRTCRPPARALCQRSGKCDHAGAPYDGHFLHFHCACQRYLL